MRVRLLAFAAAAALTSTLTTAAFAQPAGWSSQTGVRILETSGASLADHQVAITVDTAALVATSKLKADASDLRFYTDCTYTTEIPYWIESGVNTATTKVWLRLSSLAANATAVVYMAHGNAAAAAKSDVAAVFDGETGIPGPGLSSTNRLMGGQIGSFGNAQRGFRFRANRDMFVVSLGKRTPQGNPRYVTLFDSATQAKLTQAQVAGPADQFSYLAIAPVVLKKDAEYVLEAFFPAGDDAYYYSLPTTTNPALSFLDMRYCNNCTRDTFPTNVLTNGMNYGLPDFLFLTRKEATIEPEQLAAGFADTATCNADGSASSCGDGKVNAAANEACDDGNTVDTDACRTTCVVATCGDGIVHAGEECDDGNQADADACRNNCMAPKCGDGVVQAGEDCDDANAASGDGCSATCQVEPPAPKPTTTPEPDAASGEDANTAGANVASPGPSGCNVGSSGGGWATAALGIGFAALAAGRRRLRQPML